MGRLTDADKLKEAITKKYLRGKKTLMKVIDEQPTAFDVDRVVEQLKKLKMRYYLTIANTGDEKLDIAYKNVGNALDRAIEIVKEGGVE